MEYNLCDFCGVLLCALCGLFLLTAKYAKPYAELRKEDMQKGLAELKNLCDEVEKS
jgi:hypothetical protein